jgi:hypothetical protein
MTPQQWGHAGICSTWDAHVSLLRIHRYRPRTEQGVFQMPQGLHLCINCIVLGARAEPCGIPAATFPGKEGSPSSENLNVLLVKKEAISLMRLIGNCNTDSLYSRSWCHVASKAFSMSKNIAAVDILLLKFRETWPVSLIHWSVMLWHARNANWLAFSKFLSAMCLWIVSTINFSKS